MEVPGPFRLQLVAMSQEVSAEIDIRLITGDDAACRAAADIMASAEPWITYGRNRDNTYNAFNVDAVYSWWFAPGSEMSLVWKDAIATSRQASDARLPYFSNLQSMLNAPQNNSLSVKVLYYLDYLTLFRRRSG